MEKIAIVPDKRKKKRGNDNERRYDHISRNDKGVQQEKDRGEGGARMGWAIHYWVRRKAKIARQYIQWVQFATPPDVLRAMC